MRQIRKFRHFHGVPADLLTTLYDEYLPFRLYADHKSGSSSAEIAAEYRLPVFWVEERIEAARLCIEKQIRLEIPPVTPTAERVSAV